MNKTLTRAAVAASLLAPLAFAMPALAAPGAWELTAPKGIAFGCGGGDV